MRSDPAHGLAQKPPGSRLKISNLEIFHAESFYDAVAADGLLKNLRKFAKAGLAGLHRVANAAAQFADGPNRQRKKDGTGKRHPPIDVQQNRQEDREQESLAKQFSKILGNRQAGALHIVDDRGEYSPRGLLLKKSNRLADDLGVDAIPQIGDGAVPHVLNQPHAAKLAQ